MVDSLKGDAERIEVDSEIHTHERKPAIRDRMWVM
jgi:hypothetical protein